MTVESPPDWPKMAREVITRAFKLGKLEKYMHLIDEKLSLTAMNTLNQIITNNEKFSDSLNFGIYQALNPGKLFNRIEVEGFDTEHKLVVYYELGTPSSIRGLAAKTESSSRRRVAIKAFGKTFVELIAELMDYLYDKYIIKGLW